MSVSNPRVVGTATQASGGGATVNVVTTAAISGGDVIMLIAAGELNMFASKADCSGGITSTGRADANQGGGQFLVYQPTGNVAQMRATTFVTFAAQDLPIGTTFTVTFGGAAGAKAVTVVAISGASAFGVSPTSGSNAASGTGTAIGWACNVAANLMMVSGSVISGGGSDTYTEDAGWTFLHLSAAGAWPAIRVAYKASGAGGAVSYGLTDGVSRNWLSGGLFLQ